MITLSNSKYLSLQPIAAFSTSKTLPNFSSSKFQSASSFKTLSMIWSKSIYRFAHTIQILSRHSLRSIGNFLGWLGLVGRNSKLVLNVFLPLPHHHHRTRVRIKILISSQVFRPALSRRIFEFIRHQQMGHDDLDFVAGKEATRAGEFAVAKV